MQINRNKNKFVDKTEKLIVFFIEKHDWLFFVYKKMEGENKMVVRFMSDTPYARLEQEMQHIPGFRPRKSGMIVSHLSDGSKKQDCLCGHISDGVSHFTS